MNEEEIFHHALARSSPEERAAYVEQACAGDAALRASVEALLRANVGASGFLERPATTPVTTVAEQTVTQPGTVLGQYRLLEKIGEGGMGTVWMAQQQEPLKRIVALKLIKTGMDSKQVIARFEAERQALALMDHANIARVLDAGTTGAGRPYFVMDLVKGVSITRYCDEHRLTPRQRLELFIPVCQAVQHAHQKGIIHRDLKPSNVLVALYDGRPVPKVIDFGVAKAAGQPLTEQTLVTGFGNIVGTLECMSPEQAEINQLDIDTRSDIYSLGVLLYELLTGSPPFTRKELEKAGMLGMLRVIREQEPSKPSTKLSTADGLPTLAAKRGTEPAKLTKLVRGELDWIVMKALEKDRNRRYETANSFAMDVQRYLTDEPVLACAPSAAYRLRKFVRRNKAALATAATIGLALLLTVVVLAASNVLIARQRDEARLQRRLARRAVDDMYTQVAEKWLHDKPGLGPLEQEFLEKALAYYEQFAKEESDDPAIQHETALAYSRVAWICTELRQFDKAEPALRHALTVFADLAKRFPNQPQHRYELARATWNQGFLLQLRGRLEETEPFYREADADLQKLASEFPYVAAYAKELGAVYVNLGNLLDRMGRSEEWERHQERSLAFHRQLVVRFPLEPEHKNNLAMSSNNLGLVFLDVGRFTEAENAFREALTIQQELTERFPDKPHYWSMRGLAQVNLAFIASIFGRLEEAEKGTRQALGLRQSLCDRFPEIPRAKHWLATNYRDLGNLLIEFDRLSEAENALSQALRLQTELAAKYPEVAYRQELATTHNDLGVLLKAADRSDDAEKELRRALELREILVTEFPTTPDYHEDLARSLHDLGALLAATGRRPDAEQPFVRALAIQEQLNTARPKKLSYRQALANTYRHLGDLLVATGRLEEGQRTLRQAVARGERLVADFAAVPGYQSELGATFYSLATVQARQGNRAAARNAAEQALRRQQLAVQASPRHAAYRSRLSGAQELLASLETEEKE